MRIAALAFALLVLAGGASAAPTPLTVEALLAATVPAKSVQRVAGGNWWPNPPAFDTKVFQSDPQPKASVAQSFVQLGTDSRITTTLHAFGSAALAIKFLLYAELVGPAVDEKNPVVGDRRAYYTTRLADGRPATRLFFVHGRVGVSVAVDGQSWSASKIAALALPIDRGIAGLLSGSLAAPAIPAADVARMPQTAAVPGTLLGTAALSDEAWATVDRDASPAQIRDGLARRGAKLLFRRYLRTGSPTDVIETTLFTFGKPSQAVTWFQPFGAGVKSGKNALDAGKSGSHAAFRHARDNYELRFVAGRFVGDVFCYAPFVQSPSTDCEAAVRATAERWYAQLSRGR